MTVPTKSGMDRCCESPLSTHTESTSDRSSPANPDSAWEIFIEGDGLYRAMMDDIAAAESIIRMESYIFASDTIGRQIARVLAAQAGHGRQVRLRVDYAGSRLKLSVALVRELREAGVRFEWSRRWRLMRPWEFHRRNHRKLLIIDDAIAYTGGFNVHDESSHRVAGESRWRDTHVRIRGPAVRQAIDIFDELNGEVHVGAPLSSSFWLIPNSTLRCRTVWRCELDRVFRTATRRIWLTTPYFVPDRRLRRRLVRAARRGVDVRVLTPARNDVPIAQWAARALYSGLLKQGVRLFEYEPRILHAKTLLVDDAWGAVGTANLDYRSLFVNAEVNLVARHQGFCEALAIQFSTDLDSSQEIHPERWRLRSRWSIVREALAWRLRRWL
jgi:cardiolipin synthase